ncbi:MAG: hypothetical protein WEC16_00020 [Anaerolineales bacterium]
MPSRLTIIVYAVLAAVFGGSILWSIFFETLQPLLRAGRITEFWLNVIGIPMLFAGGGLLVWGGWDLVSGIFAIQADPESKRAMIQASEDAEKRGAVIAGNPNLQALVRSVGPGARRFLSGLILIVIGSLLSNWLPGILE